MHSESSRHTWETLILGRESALPHVRFSMDSQRVKTGQLGTRIGQRWSTILSGTIFGRWFFFHI